ncbi:hypothetical protein AGMMS50262_08670 [Bacteroidia bacterium]|nr:hypothetical protein AGMMS50262_08670 [Bacteroidia bacterium]
MSGCVSNFPKSKQKQNGEFFTQSVYNELIYSNLPLCQKAEYCRILHSFSYQTVIRVVTGMKTGNRVQIREIQSVSYVVIHSILHNKERL